MAARTSGLARDIRSSHPYGTFTKIKHNPICLDTGDVQARAMLRRLEVTQSLKYIGTLLDNCESEPVTRKNEIKLNPD
jgi:Ni,Fe-hydrogenase III large subunit